MSTYSYFEKELPQHPIYINGHPHRFDLLKTDDANLIQHLDSAAQKRIGGIVKLTEYQYEDKLKKKAAQPSSLRKPHRREEVRQKLFVRNQSRPGAGRAAVGVDEKPAQTPAQAIAAVAGPIDFTTFKPPVSKGVLI